MVPEKWDTLLQFTALTVSRPWHRETEPRSRIPKLSSHEKLKPQVAVLEHEMLRAGGYRPRSTKPSGTCVKEPSEKCIVHLMPQ